METKKIYKPIKITQKLTSTNINNNKSALTMGLTADGALLFSTPTLPVISQEEISSKLSSPSLSESQSGSPSLSESTSESQSQSNSPITQSSSMMSPKSLLLSLAAHRPLLPSSHSTHSQSFDNDESSELINNENSLINSLTEEQSPALTSTNNISSLLTTFSINTGHPSSSSDLDPNEVVVGVYTRAERAAKIARYREKRVRRQWNKKIMYNCRKSFADNRPRVGGRFIKMKEPQQITQENISTSSNSLSSTSNPSSSSLNNNNNNTNEENKKTDIHIIDNNNNLDLSIPSIPRINSVEIKSEPKRRKKGK